MKGMNMSHHAISLWGISQKNMPKGVSHQWMLGPLEKIYQIYPSPASLKSSFATGACQSSKKQLNTSPGLDFRKPSWQDCCRKRSWRPRLWGFWTVLHMTAGWNVLAWRVLAQPWCCSPIFFCLDWRMHNLEWCNKSSTVRLFLGP